jgi:hypothetical protein
MSKIENALPKPKIELYSGKYFAACAVGGIIGIFPSPPPSLYLHIADDGTCFQHAAQHTQPSPP